jgi:DMSO/TMAO reductase YedYZ heme-binding membrane subunit
MGVAAFYGLVVVAGSFYMKRWIGQRRWRAIHFASLGVFVSSLVHGIWAGTDTSVMIGLYLGAAIVVFSLVAIRITEDMAKTVEAAGAPRETSGRST